MALSVKDLCEIIKLCRKSGVVEFEHDGLRLRLGNEVPQEPPRPMTPAEREKQKLDEAKALLENERRVRLEQLDTLKLTDPEEYEALIARGELEHVGEESTGT